MALRPTHAYISNDASAWLSEFREELPGFLENFVGKMGESVNGLPPTEFVIVYRLQTNADQDKPDEYDEYIQAGGHHERMTVEIRLKSDCGYALYKIGHPPGDSEPKMTEVDVSGNSFPVQENEVLNSADAIGLFEHFYDHHEVAPGWNARPILWFDHDGKVIDEPERSAP